MAQNYVENALKKFSFFPFNFHHFSINLINYSFKSNIINCSLFFFLNDTLQTFIEFLPRSLIQKSLSIHNFIYNYYLRLVEGTFYTRLSVSRFKSYLIAV